MLRQNKVSIYIHYRKNKAEAAKCLCFVYNYFRNSCLTYIYYVL